MADRFVQTHIRRLPIFQHLDDRQLGLIARAFEVMRFEPGEVVFRQGQPALGLYMLVSGQGVLVQVGPDGRERTLGVVRENQYLNEATLFKESTETASLRITQTAIMLVLRRQRLLTTLTHQPELKAALGISAKQSQPRVLKPTSFKGLRDDEQILVMTRRHWWAFGRRVWLMVLLVILILIGAAMMPIPLLGWSLAGLSVIGPGILLFYFYFEWSNDLVIVTNQRVIRIERTIIVFSTHISELPIENVHEASAETPSTDPFARLFNYGTLNIKTAGQAGNMVWDFVPDAENVQDTILNRRSHQQNYVSEQRRQSIRAEIDRLMGTDHGTVGGKLSAAASRGQIQTQTQSSSLNLIRTKFVDAKGATVYRKHTTIWLRHVFLPSMVILAGVGIFILSLIHPSFQHVGVIGPILAFFVMLVGGIWFYWADWDWRNDIYIIGDETITLVRKRPLWLQNENDQFLLSRVDNVVSDIRGPLRNLLNYGTVRVSLFGSDTADMKLLEDIPNPREVQAEISRRRERARMRTEESEAKRQREAISEYLSVYHETVNPSPTYDAEESSTGPTYSSTVSPNQDRSRPPNIPRIRRD